MSMTSPEGLEQGSSKAGDVSVPLEGIIDTEGKPTPILSPEEAHAALGRHFRVRAQRIQELGGDHELEMDEFFDARLQEFLVEQGGDDPLYKMDGVEQGTEGVVLERVARLWANRLEAADTIANDPEIKEITDGYKALVTQVEQRNAKLFERRRQNPEMNPIEFLQEFEPITIQNELRGRAAELLGNVDKKLKAIDPHWSVYTHPSTAKMAEALTSMHGVAPWSKVLKQEAGLFRVYGDPTQTRYEPAKPDERPQLVEQEVEGELGGGKRGPTFTRRRETPEEVKARLAQGPDTFVEAEHFRPLGLVSDSDLAGDMANAALEAVGDTLISGGVKAAKWAWELGSIVGFGMLGAEAPPGSNPFQLPQDWVWHEPTQSYKPVDIQFGIPELAASVRAGGLRDQILYYAEEKRRMQAAALASRPWFHKVLVDASGLVAGLYAFSKMAGPLMQVGRLAGEAAAVSRGTQAAIAKGLAEFSTAATPRMEKLRRAVGGLIGEGIALGGYEAATAASMPDELAERFKHGFMFAPIWTALGAMGKQTEAFLGRRRMPRHVSRAIGGAIEGLGMTTFESLGGTSGPLFGDTPEGYALWEALKDPNRSNLDEFLRRMSTNILGFMALKTFGGYGREAEEMRKEAELQGARSQVRLSFSRSEMERIGNERLAMAQQGKPFERTTEQVGELLRPHERERFGKVAEALKNEGEFVKQFEKRAEFSPSQRVLLDMIGRTRAKEGENVEFEVPNNLFGRLGNIAKRRQMIRGKHDKPLMGEVGLVFAREPNGEVTGKMQWGKSEEVGSGKSPSVNLGEAMRRIARELGETDEALLKSKLLARVENDVLTIHEHPGNQPPSHADLLVYTGIGKRAPQFVTHSEGVYALFPSGKTVSIDAIRSIQGTVDQAVSLVPEGLYRKQSAGQELTFQEKQALQESRAAIDQHVETILNTLGWEYRRMSFQEAQRAFDQWREKGGIPGANIPPKSREQIEAQERLEQEGFRLESVPTEPSDRADTQRTVEDWFRRKSEEYAKGGHPAALFEGIISGKAPISGVRDARFVEPAIRELFDELGIEGRLPTPESLRAVMKALELPLRTPRGLLFTEPPKFSILERRAEEGPMEVRSALPPPEERSEQGRQIDKMFSAQTESRYARDYTDWRKKFKSKVSSWAKGVRELASAFRPQAGAEKRKGLARKVRNLGVRGQREKIAGEWEPTLTAELDNLSTGFSRSGFETSEDMLHVFQGYDKRYPDPTERWDKMNEAIRYSMVRDILANSFRETRDAQGNVTIEFADLPMGLDVEHWQAERARLERAGGDELQATYSRLRTVLDQAFQSMMDRGLAVEAMRRPEYFPRRVADFGDLWGAVMGQPRMQSAVKERARGYLKKREGSERLLDPRIEVLQDYLQKVRIDNEIHDFYERIGRETNKAALDDNGLTLAGIDAMSNDEWRQTQKALEDQGIVVMDVRAGAIGRHKIESHPVFQAIVADLRARGVDMPEDLMFGKFFRPDPTQGRYLVPKGVYQALQAVRQISPLYKFGALNSARRFFGRWWKLPALRGLAGTKTLARVGRNAFTDETGILFKHPDGFRAAFDVLRPSVAAATHRVVRWLTEPKQERRTAVWNKMTPFERSMALEMEAYGTVKSGLFTHEIERSEPRWIEQLMPQQQSFLNKLLRTLVGDHELARKVDDYAENWFKVALFLRERMVRFGHSIEKGLPKDPLPADLEAARAAHIAVGETLVSYKWLMPFERVGLSGFLVPFYTWAKGNATGVVASIIERPYSTAAKAGLAFALVQMYNHYFFGDEEDKLQQTHPDVASRFHLITGLTDAFGNPMVLDFEDSLTAGLGFLFGIGEAPSKMISFAKHGDFNVLMRDLVIGGIESEKKELQEWLNPLIRSMGGDIYRSKFETAGERAENVFDSDFVTMFRPAADLRALLHAGRDRSLGQDVASFVPFLGFVDLTQGVKAAQRSGEFFAGRLQRGDARVSAVVKDNMRRFYAGFSADNAEGTKQMRAAFERAWAEVGPALEESGRTKIHLLSRFVAATEREQLKRKQATAGGPIPARFHTLSTDQKALFLLWLLEKRQGK